MRRSRRWKGGKHWQQEAIKRVGEAEERLASLREERRKCAELYQQAALESSSEVLDGPSIGVLASALKVAPKAADYLEAEEAQRVQGLLASLKEVLDGGAKRAAEKEEQEAAAAKTKEDVPDSVGAGAAARAKRPSKESGEEQPDMDDFDADQAVAAGLGPELLGKLPPGAKEVMAHLIEQYRLPAGSG